MQYAIEEPRYYEIDKNFLFSMNCITSNQHIKSKHETKILKNTISVIFRDFFFECAGKTPTDHNDWSPS